ncbi:MAG: tRNA (adenine-N1)-methyltransferase [Candidatus Aenigmarchaeota archaeon]|nr:tRNA (adenine-N1)-methyltransferase [Candidatus Aenigmarchaeota archaeon]MCK5372889.1 tRNA (adenine-N1)-methyltransferase [Candidatus Aenigmarchaeota archaeon]MCK5452409.1 tRNA (adenine-N1)-methyltransferase [Candidatus Aenigmarchaeota archaeon]
MTKIKEGDQAIIMHDSGNSYLIDIELRTFHSQYGAFSLKDIIGKDYGKRYKTASGDEFLVLEPDFRDMLAKSLKRGPQIIHPKDVGIIISFCGIGKDTKVLEAGCGSAFLTSYLSNIAKSVVSWEKNEKHYKICTGNIKNMNLKNVEVKPGDIKEEKNKDFNVVILDMPKPEETIPHITKNLKIGGRIAVYSPCIEQSTSAIETLEKLGFANIMFRECIIRDWEHDKCIRPKTDMLGHTGFLVFARYLGKRTSKKM